MNATPIFIHSLFRSGSTYLFKLCRSSPAGYWCYQEPLHEAVLAANEDPRKVGLTERASRARGLARRFETTLAERARADGRLVADGLVRAQQAEVGKAEARAQAHQERELLQQVQQAAYQTQSREVEARAQLRQAERREADLRDTVQRRFLLRSDNGLVFTSPSYTALVKSYGLQQQFITPYSPEQNGMVERVIRTLKEQCVHRHRFETLQHAGRVIADWIGLYNHQRPHQALNMRTSAEAYALAA